MSRRRRVVRRVVRDAGLSGVEADYVADLDARLVGVPGPDRRSFLVDIAEVLSGRPAATDESELVTALGPPAELARDWRGSEGFDRWLPPWQRWWRQTRRARALQLTVLLAALVVAAGARAYYSAEPEIVNSCTGVAATEVEQRRAAGVSEQIITHRSGERFGVSLCPGSRDDGVTFERIYQGGGAGYHFQEVGWEVDPGGGIEWTGDATRHQSWGADEPAGWAQVMVWFEMDSCIQEGASVSFDAMQVDYRYRGRSRTTTVPLVVTVSVAGGPGCTSEERSDFDARLEVGNEIINDRLYPRQQPLPSLGGSALRPLQVGLDLCRYLVGIRPIRSDDGARRYGEFEPLEARAVFQVDDREIAIAVIDAAVLGICPEFADRRDELVGMLDR